MPPAVPLHSEAILSPWIAMLSAPPRHSSLESSSKEPRLRVGSAAVLRRWDSVQVSKASSELMSYCEQHARTDPLLVGVPASENPFKDKKPCIIL
ncbi:guanine nucleotide-binding protein G(I)/G(S)/G(O) subunit gamma-7 isoform X2 [Peromyscus californicus insignis]|uniref:guanine nucleotide-binding protein G(I)/G(S)/G(O) subunit gamma-7 isoform X2 n=1 Tax=Peromyscus californicus insignis TaxID=564181 RepID=UPI0022A7C9D4|nr:guanine nucleotide-binding protein G(I)/G(S)/G(O) subunit gamma-7 isoform X2 [Peromyscus californicus insignis]